MIINNVIMGSGENLDAELATQDDLIAQINTALEGKSVPGGGTSGPVVETSTVTFSAVDAEEVFYTRFENGELVHYDGISYDYTNQTIDNIVLGSLIHIFLNGEWYEKKTQGAEIINTYGDGSYTYLIYQVLEPNAYIALEYV